MNYCKKQLDNMGKTTRLLFLMVIALCSCKKDMVDARSGNQPTYDNVTNSSVRLVPQEIYVDGGYDIKIGSTVLTSGSNGTGGGGIYIPYPTKYFPETGKLNTPYFIPQEFIDGNGNAYVVLFNGGSQLDSFLVKNDFYNPKDYYLISGTKGIGAIEVPRPTLPLTNPTNIRVRIINFSDPNNKPSSAVSLAFSNGNKVSNVTSGIDFGKWSEYIELPYGTYSFRVLLDNQTDGQISAVVPKGQLFSVESPTNYAIGGGQYYIATRTFQPGGVYSVVVSPRNGFQDLQSDKKMALNLFDVVTDLKPSANVQYGKVQIVNSSVVGGLKVQIDGTQTMDVVYGKSSDYKILTAGIHTVKLLDNSNNILSQKVIQVRGGDNISLWSYTDASNATSLVVVSNNMGSLHQIGTNPDGADAGSLVYDPLNFYMVGSVRFLNLCPDLPFVTFTKDNGTLYTSDFFSTTLASQNLQPSITADSAAVYPYVDLGFGTYNKIEVYKSTPNVVPGDRITSIKPLTQNAFVSLPSSFYKYDAPSVEPGVYTVALIGREKYGVHPQMIVIKHNQ